jgi:uncharacterized protein (DUF433 family)
MVPTAGRQRYIQEKTMSDLLHRITINPEQCGGCPCVRGMRIRVVDVLELIAAGLNFEQTLEEMPDLELEDIQACVLFATRRIEHPMLAVKSKV